MAEIVVQLHSKEHFLSGRGLGAISTKGPLSPLEHTRSAIPRSPTMKGIPSFCLLVKVAFRGVFQFGVLKQP